MENKSKKEIHNAHEDLSCPECGSPMELAFSDRWRYRNGEARRFYRCYKHPECTGFHSAHPNGAPVGIPAGKETRELRREVHKQLNAIFPWKTKKGRKQTGRWLKKNGFGNGHVSQMDAKQCRDALEIIKKMS